MNPSLLNKVEEFVKIATAEIKDLKEERNEKQAELSRTIEKIAEQLYDADFLTDLGSMR